jgi:4-amino-4-deoxy-L-arabinose transferase-like glycosyltransferase
VVPIWPALLAVVFHFTGVSLVATRAVNVLFSVATVVLLYFLVLRYQGSRFAAALAALLLAASPFAFVFSRLATLDTLIVFEWTLAMWLASYIGSRRSFPAIALCLLLPVMMLTKTTALVLLPAVLWILWKKSRRVLVASIAVTGVALGIYLLLILHSRYAGDYRYFFEINAMAEVNLKQTGCFLLQLFENSLWVDRLLYPVCLAILLLAVMWLRTLWKNPLFTACWIALAAEAVFILRRQDDYAPRYFLAMLVPMILIAVLTLDKLDRLSAKSRAIGWTLNGVLALAVVLNGWQISGFLRHRQYQYLTAANSIRAIVDADPTAPRLVLGTSADQLSLMNGIPSINDSYTSEELGAKVKALQPGWYLGWNDLDQDILGSLSGWDLKEVANYPVFDRDERNRLKLYRMVPLKETSQQ